MRILKIALFLFLAVSSATTPANAQAGGKNRAATGKQTALDSFLVDAVTRNWVAGSTAIILQNGKIVYDKAFGFRDREAGIRMKTSDIFRIASMTKPIVSTAALILVERGKLNLDDEVAKYIPEFRHPTVLKTFNKEDGSYTTEPARSEITVRQLLTHTSGIGYGFQDEKLNVIYQENGIPDLAITGNVTIGEKMKKLGTLPLGVQPGSKFFYGLSIDVLGYVIEVASGEPLDRFVTNNILKPLKMDDTRFFLPDGKKDRLVTMYSDAKNQPLTRIPEMNGNYNTLYPVRGARTYFSGGSGLSSTTHDYARFLQMILGGGEHNGVRILKQETVSMMCSNQLGTLNLGRGNKFGFGFEIEQGNKAPNGARAGKLAWGGAFNTTFWIDPDRRSIAVLMTQAYPASHSQALYGGFEKRVNEWLDNHNPL
ncbi:serine hydrolase domain-containing protein [Hufsiella ginkgonis]|uniref:Serine hydrolase n=1 Tax=Hufsiella ginkgonis TaxID=2695274 RepID=A0A7K1Y1C7_9SPHI|nr:serine hydrolase domain-containing protein [Hufsiella ginkgonis]MXV17055.1 serine hydrolase [Hufsiella ginkgonis]